MLLQKYEKKKYFVLFGFVSLPSAFSNTKTTFSIIAITLVNSIKKPNWEKLISLRWKRNPKTAYKHVHTLSVQYRDNCQSSFL